MKFTPLKTSFNAGIFSPLMYGRTDLEKYASACEEIVNFIPTVQGALIRRPGTKYINGIKDSSNKAYLAKFVFNYQQSFLLEFGNQYVRFYNNYAYLSCGTPAAYNGGTTYAKGDLVVSGGINYYSKQSSNTGHTPASSPTWWYALTSDIYEIPTPYTLSDMVNSDGAFNLSMVQSGDVIYIANSNHTPYKLQRYSNTKWILSEMDLKKQPFQSHNTDQSITLTVANLVNYIGTPFVEYSVNLTSSSALFTNSMIGTNISFEVTNDDTIKPWSSQKGTSETTDVGDIIKNDGKYYGCSASTAGKQTWYAAPIHTEGGRWDGEEVQWWYLSDGFGIIRIDTVTNSTTATGTVLRQVPNIGGSSSVLSSVILPATKTMTLTSSSSMSATNNAVLGTLSSPSDITAGANQVVITGADISVTYTSGAPTDTGTTWAWAKSAWNSDDGYPDKVTFFRNRLVFARDQTLWFSVSADYENFYAKEFGQILDDSAITLSVPFDRVSVINYIKSSKAGLLVGSTDQEALCSQASTASPFSPSNSKIDITTSYGSKNIDPLPIDDVVLFVQRFGKKVRALQYQFQTDNFIAEDITVLAEHITQNGIVDIDFAKEPHNIMWAVKGDGTLIGLTYNRLQNVLAWHKHTIGGNGFVESICVLPSYDGSTDDLFMIVKRTINGQTKRYIEYLTYPFQINDDITDAYYVDCGGVYDGAATDTLTISWLPNTEVQVLGDGKYSGLFTTDGSGIATLDYEVTKSSIGFQYQSYVRTMKIDGGSQLGTGQGKNKEVTDLMMRLVNTLGVEVGSYQFDTLGNELFYPIDIYYTDVNMDTHPELINDDIIVKMDAAIDKKANIVIKIDQPYPATIVALSPTCETYER